MKREDVYHLANSPVLPGGSAEVLETHLSWVLLNDTYVFKIKKPVRLSFVDYRLRAQRRYYCAREVKLNRRYAPGVYLGVVPLGHQNGQWAVGDQLDEVIDYGIQMNRLDNRLQLNNLLSANQLSENDVLRLADTLAAFHRRAEKVAMPLDPQRLAQDFTDIGQVSVEVTAILGPEANAWIERCRQLAPVLVERWRERLQKRAARGWRIDGHGDLHAGNVFIYPREVLFFDAIEFNDSWRQIDVLDELAFLSVDLAYYQRSDFVEALWNRYQEVYPNCMVAADRELFLFFACYRASVRLKVAALLWRQEITQPPNGHNREGALAEARSRAGRYFELMRSYWERLPIEETARMSSKD
jgi:hypothetical protein